MNHSVETESENSLMKILIVEDEESNYELLKAMLRKTEFEIFWAQNGIQAIEFCERHLFKLILMDIKMPEMNGYEAIKIIRNRGIETPIIAQTAYARIEDESTSLKMGFNGYISKPIDRKKLFDLINKFIE
jgi:CheY-like chemotaxis protein